MNFIKQLVVKFFSDAQLSHFFASVFFGVSMLTLVLIINLSGYVAAFAFVVSAIGYYLFCKGILEEDDELSF